MMEKLNRQEGLITVWELTDILWQVKRGAPLGYRFAKSGSPVIDDSIGLIKGARHPAAAKAFIEYVGSFEAQELAARESFRLPARTDIPSDQLPAWARGVIHDLIPADVDWPLIAKDGSSWMATWDRTVRNQGGAHH
jgi:iron(III) transport system substrate-binding protein